MNTLACICCNCRQQLQISLGCAITWVISMIIIFALMGYGMSKAADEDAEAWTNAGTYREEK